MSGSPVFVGRQAAWAPSPTRFPFGKEPIAGITPIAEMLEAAANPARRAPPPPASGRSAPRLRFAAPLDREAVAAALRGPLRAARPGRLPGRAAAAERSPEPRCSPLALPLVFSGFEPDTFDWARGVFSAMGFAPVMGGGGGGASPGPSPDLAPGAAVGISLVEGDLDLSVTRHGHAHRPGPRLRLRPPLLQPRARRSSR